MARIFLMLMISLPALAASPLFGTWRTECWNEEGDDAISEQLRIQFNDTEYETTDTTYADKDCRTLAFESRSTGTYTLRSVGARGEIDSQTKRTLLRMFGVEVRRANDNALCDIRDWKEGEFRDVSRNDVCANAGLVNGRRFDIFELRADELFFGVVPKGAIYWSEFGVTAATRATQLHDKPFYRR